MAYSRIPRGVIIFLLAAACCFIGNLSLSYFHPWEPLVFQPPLTQGNAESPEFEIKLANTYTIALDAEPRIDPDLLDCLLGLNALENKRCEYVHDVVDITWRLMRGSEVVTQGSSNDKVTGYWGHTVGRVIGTFAAQKGDRYTLRLTIGRDANELADAHAKILVSVPLDQIPWYARISKISALATLLCLAGAIVTLLRSVNKKTRRKKIR